MATDPENEEFKKYITLSGLQAFYNELKKNTSADSAFNVNSDHPISNKTISTYISMNEDNVNTLSGAALSGSAASAWIDAFTGKDGVITNLTVKNLSGQSVTADDLTSTSATITTLSSTNISGDNVTASSISASTAQGESAKFDNILSTNITSTDISSTAISSTNLTALTASGTSAIFTGISAQSISGDLSGTAEEAKKLEIARDISITGDEIDWTVSFDGSQNTAASGHIKKVYWDALTGNTAGSASTSTTGIMTPDQIQAAIDDKVSEAIGSVYQIKGNAAWTDLTAAGSTAQQNGYVYNIIGEVPDNAVDHNGNRIFVGDNVVWVSSYKAANSWDKLANTMEMTGKLDTTAFNTWSSNTFTNFTANTAKYAQNVGEGNTAQNATNVITSATAGSAAYDWVTAHAKQTITGVTTAAGQNASLGITASTSTSGTSITLNASGYKTTLTTGDWVTGSTVNTYDITYGLSDSAITYMQEGHAASAAVSSLINGDTISAEKIIANDGFSGTNISGANGTTSTIDNLIGSAQSGTEASAWINTNTTNGSANNAISATNATLLSGYSFVPYTSDEIVSGINW